MSSKKLILSGIIPIFILGSITHFAYDWCSITLLGLVAPINSSSLFYLIHLVILIIFINTIYYKNKYKEINK